MAKRKSPKEDKQPETKDNSQVKIAMITGIVAIVTVIITAIAGPVLLKILDRTPTPPAVELEPASTQISAASTSVPADTTQLPSNASTAQYPISLSVDAEVKLNAARAEVVYKILETQIDSYNTENLSLKFLIRMTNNGTIDSPFGWGSSSLRLLVDEIPYEPINTVGKITIVSSQSAKEEEFVFVFPVASKNLVLRISHYEDSTEIPINLP
ncbi:MAG: hypothetical protein U0V48_08070 [Anaerolineales bacterium]